MIGYFVWALVAVMGAVAAGVVALSRGEPVNSIWLVLAAACTYALGFRFYGKFIAARVLALDNRRATPAERLDNGHDFEPTNKWIVFGHHFAAIPVRARWSARCWPRSSAICRGRSGSSSAWCSAARYRTL